METTATTWITKELAQLSCGDERLQARSEHVLGLLAAQPGVSIPAACARKAEVDTTYALFDNPRVSGDAILTAHTRATRDRMAEQDTVILAADLTELNYTDKVVAQELGYIGENKTRGCFLLPLLAMTEHGVALGLADAQFYERTDISTSSKTRKNLPITEKETRYILQAYQQACRLQQDLPDTKLLFLFDRGGDIYELYEEYAQAQWPHPADFLIRGCDYDRCLNDIVTVGGQPTSKSRARHRKLRTVLQLAPVCGELTWDLPAQGTQPGRVVQQEVRAVTVTLRPPYRKGVKLHPVSLQVIWCHEINPPADVEPVDWLLYTSLPITTMAQVLWAIQRYQQRWTVELYFKVLKSGCQVEQLYLQTKERLMTALAFYLIVAWRVLLFTRLGREAPDLPCTVLFSTLEWHLLVWHFFKRLPAAVPSLQEVVRLLGRLGGYMGRRGDGEPGIQTLWKGRCRLRDLVHGALAAEVGRQAVAT